MFLVHFLHPGSVDELHQIISDFQRRVQEKENTLRNVSALFDLSIPLLAAARLFQRLSKPGFIAFRGFQKRFLAYQNPRNTFINMNFSQSSSKHYTSKPCLIAT